MAQDDKVGTTASPRQGRPQGVGREVGRLLASLLGPAARQRGFAEASLLTGWSLIVGLGLGGRCQPVRIDYAPGRRRGGTLLIQAGAAAALEVQHAAPQIVERVNTFFGFPAVRQLRLLQMPLDTHQKRQGRRLALNRREIDPSEARHLHEVVNGIADLELRNALLSLGHTVRSG